MISLKKTKSIFVFLLIACLLNSCNLNSSNQSNQDEIDYGEIVSSLIIRPKKILLQSVYDYNTNIENVKSRFSWWGMSKLFSYSDSDGKVQPVLFNSSSGYQVALMVNTVEKIEEPFIWVAFDGVLIMKENSDIPSGTSVTQVQSWGGINRIALINFNNGTTYDFSEYDLSTCIIKDNILYCIKEGTVFQIDLHNIDIAIPMNNGEITPITELLFIEGNKLIANYKNKTRHNLINKNYILDISLKNFPLEIKSYSNILYGDPSNQFRDRNGDIYGYSHYSIGGTFKLSLDEKGQTSISDYNQINIPYEVSGATNIFSNINDSERIIIKDKGYVIIEQNPNEGLQMFLIDCPILTDCPVTNEHLSSVHRTKPNEYIWLDGNNIKQLLIDLDDHTYSYEVLYTSTNIIQTEGLIIEDDRIYFSAYLDISTVGKFFITRTNSNPISVGKSDIPYTQIIEMDFSNLY